jgi:hypothetical protein
MEKHRRQHIMGAPMDRAAKETFDALNAALMKLLPKKMMRRGVR